VSLITDAYKIAHYVPRHEFALNLTKAQIPLGSTRLDTFDVFNRSSQNCKCTLGDTPSTAMLLITTLGNSLV